MKKFWLGSLFFIFLESVYATPIQEISKAPIDNWTGFYLGITGGGSLAQFNINTSNQLGPIPNPRLVTLINIIGNHKLYAPGFITGVEGGFNWQVNHLLLGLETDLQALSLNSTGNSGAIPEPIRGRPFVIISSYVNNNWLFTTRARLGLVTNNLLFYVTGGLALTMLESDFLFTNNLGEVESRRVNKLKPGYIVGTGVEWSLNKAVSLKAEYLYEHFSNTNSFNMSHTIPSGHIFSNSVNLQNNILRLGLNYHFNECLPPFYTELMGLINQNEWESEVGARPFLSSGTIGAPQPLLNTNGTVLISRLTYKYLTAISGETFARFDHSTGLFVKGYLGAGSVIHGQLNDEDFPAGGAYSNTYSGIRGNLSYANIDLGYSFIKTPFAKTGAFIGYNYYAQNVKAYGCRQLAGATICNDFSFQSFLGIAEEDRFNSLRVGLSSLFNITDQLNLSGEVAYLPIVNFKGQDDHNARQLILPEHASFGNGVMLESFLNYELDHSWNIGLGARYWVWNSRNGTVFFNFLGENDGDLQVARYDTDRYGVFLQLSYKDRGCNHPNVIVSPADWKGVFIGGQLGGAWSRSRWSDPFGSTISPENFINVAGFGDDIQLKGPLAGANINLNWQTNQWLYGIGGTISSADIRGENTLFSGLGGINGQAIIKYLATIYGKLGVTCNRSLIYLNAGRALLNTKYNLNGNTDELELGSQTKTTSHWGWLAGAGVEYALTDCWSTGFVYNYIYIPHHSVSFSAIEEVNNQNIRVNQTLHLFNITLNYKLF